MFSASIDWICWKRCAWFFLLRLINRHILNLVSNCNVLMQSETMVIMERTEMTLLLSDCDILIRSGTFICYAVAMERTETTLILDCNVLILDSKQVGLWFLAMLSPWKELAWLCSCSIVISWFEIESKVIFDVSVSSCSELRFILKIAVVVVHWCGDKLRSINSSR